ncbi:hypothetical protein L226DRAFT_517439 [Lentinus tigrinus ALCF2SS1-7]|uniref:uncharacterized protein n=1 Tax=Lentinus tigrinus ALCF2SS1-7 TaxID=1328758 RepID=UPI00116615F0|nr:hypothetical protein L226DRAFT_517439 [Lentinus tigrinus ALCF2SS1-7]
MQHHTLPTPTSRPARQGQHSQQSAASARPPLCWFDEYLMSIVPGHTPADENDLNIMLELMGATPETRDQVLESYNMMAKDLVKTAGVRVMKPKPTDPVYSVQIPNSPLVFRIWEGGMDFYGHFCVDFYDPRRKVSVNLPRGTPCTPQASPPASDTCPTLSRLLSLERSMGMDSFPEGEEKWMIPEGTYVTLRREGHPLFTFQMPNRRPQTIAQPRWGVM